MSGPYSEKKSGGAPHPKGTGRVSNKKKKSPAGAEKPANIVEAGEPAANSGHDEAVRGMFGRIVRFYDFLNHFLSFGIDRKWRKVLAASIKSGPNDRILDLGCGTGLTSLIIAKETGAKVFANDLWVSAEENQKRFDRWGVGGQITPVCVDANNLPF